MPTYKLYYFNITGMGEPVRFVLSYAGVKFEDVRYSFEEWPKHKAGKIFYLLEIHSRKNYFLKYIP